MDGTELLGKTKINANGRIVLPAAMRNAIGVKPGDEILLRVEDGEICVYTMANAIRQAQELIRPYAKGKGSMVDELIRERRREARREMQEIKAHRKVRVAGRAG